MPVTRRTLLLAAGVGVASAALAGCSTQRPAPQPTSSTPVPPPPPTTTTAPPPPDWNALRGKVSGGLVLPGDPDYATARHGYNPLFDDRKPAAVARCATQADVQACVAVAAESRLPVAARSGGHSYAGYSSPDDGLVLDLAGMADVQVRQDGTAVVGAGARLADVYAALAKAGRCLPAGSCPTVGVAGLTLGGGIGVLARKFGLTCDRLTSAAVVTADGTARTASADSEPELFWALRGGGGGNLGVVTSFTFATEPAPELAVFSLKFPAGAAADVLGGWQGWIANAPDELWANCVVHAGGSPQVSGCFVGGSAGLNPLLDRLVAATTQPTNRFVRDQAYLDAMRFFAGDANAPRESFVASARILGAPLSDPAAAVASLSGLSGVDLLFDGLGGAVARTPADATAFPHRSALASVQIYANAAGGAQRATQEVDQVRAALGNLLGPSSYVNYIDPTLPDWATAYYGGNLARLRAAAHKYDPNGVFAFAQGLTKA
ncbi:FAD-binding oxidoreductase [Solihabitans fulvus]|uniref:FAD-binding oxidoreductase n=1 Tax=Solihabitans fulvus TaxID=1892852 RepID=A0A5B2XNC8_9PSEU|nr:FAD-binding oxidoreductase [Solihabitans fulvus]KAA2264655.1 FAD-binding oxidoreductase [Solihabitans fulvus]